MDYSVSFETGAENKADKLSNNSIRAEQEIKDQGLASLKKGQQITGTVVSVDEQVTLDFNGQKVKAEKNVLADAIPGETKTFEVVKASDKEIELRLLDGSSRQRKSFIAVRSADTDWSTVMSQKSLNAKKAEKEAQYKETAGQLEEISSRLTEKDCRLLEEEGFPIESYSISGLYEALNRIKSESGSQEVNTSQEVKAVQSSDQKTIQSTVKSLAQNTVQSPVQSTVLSSAQNTVQSIVQSSAQNTVQSMAQSSAQNTASNSVQNQPGITAAASSVENALALRLKEADLPVTAENLAKVSKALELCSAASKLDDKAIQYLISRNVEPTPANIYKACYSGTVRNYPLTDRAWSGLEGQVKEVIKAAGYEVNEENLKTARWLVENNLPLTQETFTYKKKLEEIKDDINPETALNRIIEGMKNGITPTEVSLIPLKEASGEQILADIHSILPDTVTLAVKAGLELTIRNLAALAKTTEAASSSEQEAAVTSFEETAAVTNTQDQENRTIVTDAGNNANKDNGASSYEEIKARRQLEEIRLKMTLEAAATLEKKGFSVETERLEKVVSALKELEDSYYAGYFKEADIPASEQSIQTLKDTTQSLKQLRSVPAYVLGSTLQDRMNQTIPSLLAEGQKLQADLNKAGAAYETLMTVPNREYGDSIKKAFANMDSLLSELGIDATDENCRAVRILGYNRMEINGENISQVKAYDLQVNTMMKNLHPAVTVRMIREGVNPLEMPINELNKTIDRIKEEQGITSEDKYSTYLRKLEKAKDITPEERKAYIGIYRLLYNVEKSDGAALGAVIKADREVTLDNLLTAVQTGKKGRLDSIINDEFGTLQSISREKETIAEQLSSFSQGADQSDNGQSAARDKAAEGTEYLDRILKQVREELSPEKLKEAAQTLINEGMTPVQPGQTQGQAVTAAYSAALTSQKGIWETMKDVPAEKLQELIQNSGDQAEGDELDTRKVQEIRELCKNSEQSIRFLNDYQVSSTPMNILIANHILSNGETPVKRLLKLQKENIVEKTENSLKEINDLSDKLIDRSSMEEAYSQLEKEAKEVLEQTCSEGQPDRLKLNELISLSRQLTFTRMLAQKEYYQIPIETKQGITNMNLTILRGTQTSGKVEVTIRSEQLGNVKADFTLKDGNLKGFISSDSRTGLERLQKNTAELEEAAAESAAVIRQIDFGLQTRNSDTYSYRNPNAEGAASIKPDTERTLYRIAKAIVRNVMAAENSGS